MTTIDRAPARLLAALGMTGALLVAGCGGSAATAAPTAAPTTAPTATSAPATAVPATAAPTSAPTAAPTVAPTAAPAGSPDATNDPALGGFAFPAADVLTYYKSIGFTCTAPAASTQAAGYTVTRCIGKDDTKGLTTIVALVTDANGVTGDAFAGVLGSDGKTMPAPEDGLKGLVFFLGAMLGKTDGTTSGTWLAQHLGEKSAQTTVNDMLVGTYLGDESSGLGYFVETANQAFMNAPAP